MKKVVPLAILALILIPAYVVAAKSDTVSATKPSIVLVHGAWADGSSWSRVIALLQDKGYTVYAPANPLRGLASDSAYIADFLHIITGPIVLVGHSYGGAVITNAATGNPNVEALVFVDAFAPDQGESLGQLSSIPPPPGLSPSCLAGDPTQVFNFVPLSSGGIDTYVKQSLFPSCFANDLPPSQGAVLASTQRAFALSALPEKSGVPAWKTIPSWYLVGTIDLAIPSWAQLFMAQRAGSTIVQVRASHLSMISHAPAVSDLIQQAATTVTRNSDTSSQLALAPTSL
ncbi:alpha/beta hydrolase [Candidatus Bathyarchaeota archaeon]|nr:MAG: alpha/beta hydrolase [Candidatus Bathyarchaeota archaeon]